jgi:hypothetical protein
MRQPTKNGDPPGSLQITLKSLRSPIALDEHDNENENENENKHSAKYSSIDASSQISLILALPRPFALA